MRNTRQLVRPLLAVVLLLLVVAYLAGAFRDQVEPGLAPAAAAIADRVAVTVVTEPVAEAVPATLGAKQASQISARVLSTIRAIHVRAGDQVKAGQLLVELDPRDLEARLAQTREQVRAAAARLQEAESNRQRIEGLFQRQLVAQAELDRAAAAADSLAAELAAQRQRVDEAETAFSYSRILAPIDGRIVDRQAEPGDTASPGSPLLAIYNPNTLRVEARVRERLALALRPGQVLKVYIPALQQQLDAALEELVPSADPGSRSFLVKARIAQDGRLLPGMYAELDVPAGERTALLIPRERVAQIGQLDLVWVATAAGAERRFVRLGGERGDRVAVLSGLEPGDKLLPVPTTAR